jgi:hypothetical protein
MLWLLLRHRGTLLLFPTVVQGYELMDAKMKEGASLSLLPRQYLCDEDVVRSVLECTEIVVASD